MTWLYIGLGGGIGAVARFGLAGWIQAHAGETFPWGTLVVNGLGSLLLGFAVVYLTGTAVSPEFRRFIAIGVLGGFTTFSTFGYETAAFLRNGEWLRAGGYAGGSLVLGVFGVLVGFVLANALLHPRG
ncbi:MAG: fluoride efflux transporter CrcB [Gemmatimonadota bacterium]